MAELSGTELSSAASVSGAGNRSSSAKSSATHVIIVLFPVFITLDLPKITKVVLSVEKRLTFIIAKRLQTCNL